MSFLLSAAANLKRKRQGDNIPSNTPKNPRHDDKNSSTPSDTVLLSDNTTINPTEQTKHAETLKNNENATDNGNTAVNTQHNITIMDKNSDTNILSSNKDDNIIQSNDITESAKQSEAKISSQDTKQNMIGKDDEMLSKDDTPTTGSIIPAAPSLTLEQLDYYRRKKYENERFIGDFTTQNKYVLYVIKRCLWIWEQDLKARPAEISNSLPGREETHDYTRTRQHLRPLFGYLKENTLDNKILVLISSICDCMQHKLYIEAETKFFELSIGDAQWPIGSAYVGIHDRLARAKIAGGSAQHILSKAETRFYIISIKKLLSYMQKKYPAE